MTKWCVLFVGVIACNAGKPPPKAIARPIDAPPSDATSVDAAVANEGSPPADDKPFADAVVRFAKRTTRFVASWGTVKLDGVHPSRFATLEVDVPSDFAAPFRRGAYIFELGPSRVIAVTFQETGRTQPFHRISAPRPISSISWSAYDDVAIDHTDGHHHGGEYFTFGERSGNLVMLRYGYTDDASDSSRPAIDEKFATKAGVCKTRCPLLAAHKFQDSRLAVSAVTDTVDDLVEPAPPPE